MDTQTTDSAVSSPATFEIPSDPAANLEWRKTGKIPDAAPAPKAASTPAKETASPAKPGETAPASATAPKQEKETKSDAAIRLDELLADLKRAGFTPAELKTFKRDATAAAPAKAEPGLVAPIEPDTSEMTFEEARTAEKKYYTALIDYKAKLAVAEDRQERAAEAQDRQWMAKVEEATARYGEQTKGILIEATDAIKNAEAAVPIAVQEVLGQSPVLMDLLYVLGSKPEELAAFVALGKSNPRAAIRKIIVMEQLVEAELAKPGSAAAGGEKVPAAGATERGADGKFVSQDPPAKPKKPAAPPPAEELNTRGSAPPDPIDAAVRASDFRAFKAEEDRRDLARRRGA